MIVKTLALKNFRNHKFLSLNFSEGINTISGPNATGKTNIVEAINYLSIAKSFRGVEDKELMLQGSEFATEINAVVVEGKLKRNIKVVITQNGRYVFVNGKRISRLSDLAKSVNVVLFEPKDVLLFKGLPKDRRNFLDINLSKKSPPYFDYISRYEKVLKARNELLKISKVDPLLLNANTEMLVKLSGPIVSYRQMYIKDINNVLNKIARSLTGQEGKIEIFYKPFVDYSASFEKKAIEAFNKVLESDLKHKATSIGIHREDFSVSLNGRDIGTYGSQGENRLVALALKLSPYFLIEDKEKRPVVVLDDVMSELDKNHQEKLVKFLKKLSQVFITGTKLEIDGANHYELHTNKEVF